MNPDGPATLSFHWAMIILAGTNAVFDYGMQKSRYEVKLVICWQRTDNFYDNDDQNIFVNDV